MNINLSSEEFSWFNTEWEVWDYCSIHHCSGCGKYMGGDRGHSVSASWRQQNNSAACGHHDIRVSISNICRNCLIPMRQIVVKKAESEELRYLINKTTRMIRQIERGNSLIDGKSRRISYEK